MPETERTRTINFYGQMLLDRNLTPQDIFEAQAILSKQWLMRGEVQKAREYREKAVAAIKQCQNLPGFKISNTLKALVKEMQSLLEHSYLVPPIDETRDQNDSAQAEADVKKPWVARIKKFEKHLEHEKQQLTQKRELGGSPSEMKHLEVEILKLNKWLGKKVKSRMAGSRRRV